jgi:hypothetical protein
VSYTTRMRFDVEWDVAKMHNKVLCAKCETERLRSACAEGWNAQVTVDTDLYAPCLCTVCVVKVVFAVKFLPNM